MNRGKGGWYFGVCLSIFLISACCYSEKNFVKNPDFEENAEGWFTYEQQVGDKTYQSTLSISDFEAYTGKFSLQVQTPGVRVLQGPGTNVAVDPEHGYIISVMAKGNGKVMLCANGEGGWVRGAHTELSPDKWKELKIRRFEKGHSFTMYIVTYTEGQKVTFYIDNVKVIKEELPEYPPVEILPIRYESEDYAGNSEIVEDVNANGGKYVEGSRQWDNKLVSNLPFPKTSKQVYIYLKVWVKGDNNSYISIVQEKMGRQELYTAIPPVFEQWVWLKTGPFTAREIGEGGVVISSGGTNITVKLDTIVISTQDNLTDIELDGKK